MRWFVGLNRIWSCRLVGFANAIRYRTFTMWLRAENHVVLSSTSGKVCKYATVPKTTEHNRDANWSRIVRAPRSWRPKLNAPSLEWRTTGENSFSRNIAKVPSVEQGWNRSAHFVSQSPDYFLPATSIIAQDRLGCQKQAAFILIWVVAGTFKNI